MLLFSIFFAYLLNNIFNLKKIIFYSFLISYLLLFFDSLIQIKTGQNIFGYPIINSRVSSLFGDRLIMGSYVARTLPILIAISYIENFRNNNLLRFFCICMAGTLIFFSAERVSFFYYIMTVVIYLFLLNNKKNLIFVISLLVITFVTIFYFKPSSIDRLYKHTLNQMNQKKGSLFSERHEMHFLTAYKMFLDKKLIGHGIKSFRYLCDDPRYTVRQEIVNNNKKFSPIDGYFYLFIIESKIYAKALFVKESEKVEFEKIIKENINNLESFNEKYSIISFDFNGKILEQVDSGTLVKKGDFVISYAEYDNGCNTHPHSTHLQILSELGLFGYFFLIAFFIYLILILIKETYYINWKKRSKNTNKNSLYFVFIVLGVVQSLFPIVPSGNIFNNWISCILYFQLGFFFNYIYFIKKIK
jgi:O-antigen ligase